MRRLLLYILPLFAAIFFSSCTQRHEVISSAKAQYFYISTGGSETSVVTVSPFNGSRDSITFTEPLKKVICLSSTLVAGFAEVGKVELVKGVSGKQYISNNTIQDDPGVIDVGYESALDYESIVAMDPDVVLAYAVSSVEAPYIMKLRSLGIKVLVVYDNFESHPLARAEYVRLCGALAGCLERADVKFSSVSSKYANLAATAPERVKVMINAPYGDAWYVPSKGSYMYRLIADAGGELLGAEDGLESSLISLETAYSFSRQADVWINPGYARTRKSLEAMHPSFDKFCREGLRIYNNTLRTNPEGGNDFYERGAMRPDLILHDLQSVFAGETTGLEYYIEVK